EPSGHLRAGGAADVQSGARPSPSSRQNHPARALSASDCPRLEEKQLKSVPAHPPGLPLCSNRRWEHRKFDGLALGWDYLIHAQFHKGLQLSRRPGSRQNGLLLPAKEHRQHTHLQPGTSHTGPRTEGPAEFGFWG
uniref:Uncharacterized protein n=1 Tax=Aotus nancymaae TaxID=37293 RepID=A0A2K5CIM5_AOTNA